MLGWDRRGLPGNCVSEVQCVPRIIWPLSSSDPDQSTYPGRAGVERAWAQERLRFGRQEQAASCGDSPDSSVAYARQNDASDDRQMPFNDLHNDRAIAFSDLQ